MKLTEHRIKVHLKSLPKLLCLACIDISTEKKKRIESSGDASKSGETWKGWTKEKNFMLFIHTHWETQTQSKDLLETYLEFSTFSLGNAYILYGSRWVWGSKRETGAHTFAFPPFIVCYCTHIHSHSRLENRSCKSSSQYIYIKWFPWFG